MKFKRTTSAEKAVVAVFVVSLPLGIALGYNFKQVPEPEVREKIVVRTVNVGDYDFDEQETTEVVDPGCREAWDATQDVLATIDRYNGAVAELSPILEDMYSTVMGNKASDVGVLNQLNERVLHHKQHDWPRLMMDGPKLDRLEETMRQCADVPE